MAERQLNVSIRGNARSFTAAVQRAQGHHRAFLAQMAQGNAAMAQGMAAANTAARTVGRNVAAAGVAAKAASNSMAQGAVAARKNAAAQNAVGVATANTGKRLRTAQQIAMGYSGQLRTAQQIAMANAGAMKHMGRAATPVSRNMQRLGFVSGTTQKNIDAARVASSRISPIFRNAQLSATQLAAGMGKTANNAARVTGGTSQLATSTKLLNSGLIAASHAAGRHSAGLSHVSRGTRDAATHSRALTGQFENYAGFIGFQMLGRQAIFMGGAIAGAMALSVRSFRDFEDTFALVRKTTDATEAQYASLSAEIRHLATVAPIAVTELNEIASVAGQLGVPTDDIAQFTQVMAEMGVATNVTAEQAALFAARIANVMQIDFGDDVDRMTNTIVDLGNNMAAREDEIFRFTERIAAAGQVVGMGTQDLLAFSATMASVGVRAERGGTAFQRVIFAMMEHVQQGGEALDLLAHTAGMSAEAFAAAWREDPAMAVASFIEGLGDAGERGNAIMAELFGNNVRTTQTFLSMAGAADLTREALERGRGAWEQNSARANEAEERFSTLASTFQMMRNRINDVAIGVGQQLAPAISAIFSTVVRAIEAFGGLTGTQREFVLVMGAVTAAVALLAGTMALMVFPMNVLRGILPEISSRFSTFTGIAAAQNRIYATQNIQVNNLSRAKAALTVAQHRLNAAYIMGSTVAATMITRFASMLRTVTRASFQMAAVTAAAWAMYRAFDAGRNAMQNAETGFVDTHSAAEDLAQGLGVTLEEYETVKRSMVEPVQAEFDSNYDELIEQLHEMDRLTREATLRRIVIEWQMRGASSEEIRVMLDQLSQPFDIDIDVEFGNLNKLSNTLDGLTNDAAHFAHESSTGLSNIAHKFGRTNDAAQNLNEVFRLIGVHARTDIADAANRFVDVADAARSSNEQTVSLSNGVTHTVSQMRGGVEQLIAAYTDSDAAGEQAANTLRTGLITGTAEFHRQLSSGASTREVFLNMLRQVRSEAREHGLDDLANAAAELLLVTGDTDTYTTYVNNLSNIAAASDAAADSTDDAGHAVGGFADDLDDAGEVIDSAEDKLKRLVDTMTSFAGGAAERFASTQAAALGVLTNALGEVQEATDRSAENARKRADEQEKLNKDLAKREEEHAKEMLSLRQEYRKDLADLEDGARKDLADAETKHADAMADLEEKRNADLLESRRKYNDAVRDLLKDRHSDLKSWAALDEEVEIEAGMTVEAITKNVREQISMMEEWISGLSTLRDRGLAETVIRQLGLDDSPAALGKVRQFVEATDSEIRRLNAAVVERNQVASRQMETEQQQLIGQLGDNLIELQNEFNREQRAIQQEFTAAQSDLNAELRKEQQEIRQALTEGQAELNQKLAEDRRELTQSLSEDTDEMKERFADAMDDMARSADDGMMHLREGFAKAREEAQLFIDFTDDMRARGIDDWFIGMIQEQGPVAMRMAMEMTTAELVAVTDEWPGLMRDVQERTILAWDETMFAENLSLGDMEGIVDDAFTTLRDEIRLQNDLEGLGFDAVSMKALEEIHETLPGGIRAAVRAVQNDPEGMASLGPKLARLAILAKSDIDDELVKWEGNFSEQGANAMAALIREIGEIEDLVPEELETTLRAEIGQYTANLMSLDELIQLIPEEKHSQFITAVQSEDLEAVVEILEETATTHKATLITESERDDLLEMQRHLQELNEYEASAKLTVTDEGTIRGVEGDLDTMVDHADRSGVAAGRAVATGLARGIEYETATVQEQVERFMTFGVMDRVNSIMGISSPSTVMRSVGQYIVDGLIEGLDSRRNALLEAAGELSHTINTTLNQGEQDRLKDQQSYERESLDKFRRYGEQVVDNADDTGKDTRRTTKSRLDETRQAGNEAAEKVANRIVLQFGRGADRVARVARGYGTELAEGVNPILSGIGEGTIPPPPRASGNRWAAFAEGGSTLPEDPQFQRAGNRPLIQWAEPETGGEWFLPHSLSKRGRAVQVAQRMADSWGYDLVPRQIYAEGGFSQDRINAVKQWASKQHGKRYRWAGVGPNTYDCSGIWSAAVNVLNNQDRIYNRLFATSSFGAQGPVGFQRGLGTVSVGVAGAGQISGSSAGHMSGTIAGSNLEASATPGVRFGPTARGATNSLYNRQYHLRGGVWLGENAAASIDLPPVPNFPYDGIVKSAPLTMEHVRKLAQEFVDANTYAGGVSSDRFENDTGANTNLQRMAKQMLAERGWGDQWAAFNRLVQKESSWNPRAQNPTSTAYGLGQFLDSTWAGVGGTKTSDPMKQLEYMMRYIDQRYNTPNRALAFHNRNNYYDSGGLLQPGRTVAYNNTGKPEVVAARGMIRDEINESFANGGMRTTAKTPWYHQTHFQNLSGKPFNPQRISNVIGNSTDLRRFASALERARNIYEEWNKQIEREQYLERRAAAYRDRDAARRELRAAQGTDERRAANERYKQSLVAIAELERDRAQQLRRQRIERQFERAEERLQRLENKAQLEFEKMSTTEQINNLRDRMRAERKYSNEWMALYREREALKEQRAEERQAIINNKTEMRFETLTTERQVVELTKRMAAVGAYTDEWKQLSDQRRQAMQQEMDSILELGRSLGSMAERFTPEWGESTQALIKNTEEQTRILIQHADNLAALRARGLSEQVIRELDLSNPANAGQLAALMRSNEQELAALNQAWTERDQAARIVRSGENLVAENPIPPPRGKAVRDASTGRLYLWLNELGGYLSAYGPGQLSHTERVYGAPQVVPVVPRGQVLGSVVNFFGRGGIDQYADLAGVRSFDVGGRLPPGLTMAYNGTRQVEYVLRESPGAQSNGVGGVFQITVENYVDGEMVSKNTTEHQAQEDRHIRIKQGKSSWQKVPA